MVISRETIATVFTDQRVIDLKWKIPGLAVTSFMPGYAVQTLWSKYSDTNKGGRDVTKGSCSPVTSPLFHSQFYRSAYSRENPETFLEAPVRSFSP